MTAGESIDEQVDALIAGERSAIEPRDDAEAARAAGLLLIHGLLSEKRQGAALHDERVLHQALNRVRRMPMRVIVRRSLAPLAIAALCALGFFTWWTITAENRAVSAVSAMHVANGSRRYDLVVDRRVSEAEHRTLRGTYDCDGSGCFVVTFPIPSGPVGNRLVFGRHGAEWWIIPPMGAIQRGTSRDLVKNWIKSLDEDAPSVLLDETLERLEADYDVTVHEDESGLRTYYAKRTAKSAGATVFLLTVNTATGKMRRVRWEWEKPCGDVAMVMAIEGTLVEHRVFPSGWFDPEIHLDAAVDLGEEPSR